MRNIIKYSALAIMMVVGGGFASLAAHAQSAKLPSAVIAVIDTQKIRSDSLAGKDFSRQVEVIQAEFQSKYGKISDQLKQEEADLQRQQTVLAPAAFETKRNAFAAKYQQAQADLQEEQRKINLAISKANNELSRALLPIFQRVTQARGATILVERSQIVLPAPQLDITDEVISSLDKVLPSVDVKVDDATASAAPAPAPAAKKK